MRTADHPLWRAWLERRDERAFESLLRPHLRFAADFARRLGLCDADADEVVQQSLVALAQHDGDKPARVGLRAWLGREVLQRARMLFRSERRRHARESLVQRSAADPMQVLETHDEVERVLAMLDEDSRWAVELRFLYDLDYAEISQVLGASTLACRLRVHRAIARLRRRLGRNASMRIATLPFLQTMPSGLNPREAALTGTAEASTGVGIVGVLVMTATTKAAIAAVAVAAGIGIWAFARERVGAPNPAQRETARRTDSPRLAGTPGARRDAASPIDTSPDARAGSVADNAAAAIPPGHGRVNGVVRFDDGSPAAGVRLGIGFSAREGVLTDSEGHFVIEDAPTGEHPFTISGPRRYALALARVNVRPDALTSVDLTIERGATLEGTLLLGAARAPVGGRLVTVRRPGGEVGPRMVQAAFAVVETDDEGRFRFEHLPRAAYQLEVHGGGGVEAREFDFEVRQDVERREFVLSPPRLLVVHFEGLPAAARGTAIQGAFGGYVSRPGSGLRTPFEGRIAEGDSVRAEAPPPGSWVLRVDATDLLPEMQKEVTVGTESSVQISIVVPPGAPVHGLLRDVDGTPMAKARIAVDSGRTVTTDMGGTFSFGWVMAGKPTFWLVLDGLRVSLGSAEVQTGEPTRLDLRPLGTASLTARLVAADVRYGVVTLWGPAAGDKFAETWPDTQGRVRLTHLAGGSYRLTAYAGGPHVTRTVEVRGGEAVDLGDIVFEEAVRVPVELIVPEGRERPTDLGGTAFRDGSGPPFQVTLRVDADGKGWLEGLTPGRWLVTFNTAAFADIRLNVDVAGPTAQQVRIELQAK